MLNLRGGNCSGTAALGSGNVLTSQGGAAPLGGVSANFGSAAGSASGTPGQFPGGGAAGSACQANGAAGAGGYVIIVY